MIADTLGYLGIYVAIAVGGAFAGSTAEYVAVERRLPTLHAAAFLVAAAVGALLSVPGHWAVVHVLGGEGGVVVAVVIHAVVAALVQRGWFTSGYAHGRLLKMEYGDEWQDHIGEEVRP